MRSIPSRALILLSLVVLGSLLFQGLLSLSPSGDLNPTFHVASRYVDRGSQETGQTFPFLAVLLDYRASYLVFFGLLNLSATSMTFLFCVLESFPVRSSERVLYGGAWVSSLALLAWGCLGLLNDGYWMDYEFLAGPSARIWGAGVTGCLSLFSFFFSAAAIRAVWVRGKEQILDRK